MSPVLGEFEKAKKYIESHSSPSEYHKRGFSITMSRQTGAGADIIADHLIDFFKPYQEENELEWTVFDKNLIDKILNDNNLPERLSQFYEEHHQTLLQTVVNDMFPGHSTYEVAKRTATTILQLINKGNVIIIGRGATMITGGMKEVIHVRFIAPLEKRIHHVMEVYQLTHKEAEDFAKREDEARKSFIKRYYHRDIDDPSLYDFIVNTGKCSYKEAAAVIGNAVLIRQASMHRS